MTIDFTNDDQLGELLRAEVPEPSATYWTELADRLESADTNAPQAIDVDQADDGAATVVPFRSTLRRSFGGMTALAIAAALLVIVGVVVGTRWQRSDSNVNAGFADGETSAASLITDPAQLDELPGPQQNRDHWHAVYGVWDCTAAAGQGDWVPAFQSDQDDTGIHSHRDGMIYIHPFFEESAGVNATFSHFIREMQLELTESTLMLDDGRMLVEGTECGGQESVLHLRRWQYDFIARAETELNPRIITENLNSERFYNDREVWILALAPLDADIPLPPPERFAALDRWAEGPIDLQLSTSTAAALGSDEFVALTQIPTTAVIEYDSRGNKLDSQPSMLFRDLTREPRPAWTENIIDDTFRHVATAGQPILSRVVMAAYRIGLEDGSSRSCISVIDLETQQIAGASYCHPNNDNAPSSLIIDEQPTLLFMRNVPEDTSYVVIRTDDTVIATNPVERHVFITWDFATNPITEIEFVNSALRTIGTCPRINAETDLACLVPADN